MPSRKRSKLSSTSAQAKRARLKRLTKSQQEREQSLASQRSRSAEYRSQETISERESRLNYHRRRNATSRCVETGVQREIRLTADRSRHTDARISETPEERKIRLSTDRRLHEISRSVETNEERIQRLSDDRHRHQISRSLETDEERESRLSADRTRHQILRYEETHEEEEQRLSDDRHRHQISRSLETDEERGSRLSADRTRHRILRYEETNEEEEQRLSDDRHRHQISRSLETDEERESRLSADRTRHRILRYEETHEEEEQRLSDDRHRHQISRSLETDEERESRLSADRTRHRILRYEETNEEEEQRLSDDRHRHQISRSLETDEERESRLSADRTRHRILRYEETHEEEVQLLSDDRHRHQISRSLETDEERESRLSADRTRHRILRYVETHEEELQRLSDDRHRHQISRSLETYDQRELRLIADRSRYYDRQEIAAHHLAEERSRIQELRQTQTSDTHMAQLEEDRLRHVVLRLSESDGVEDDSMFYDVEGLPWIGKYKSGFCYDPNIKYSAYSYLGSMNKICAHCRALKWHGEPKGMCCSSGKVNLERIQQPPEPLNGLLDGDHPQSKHFLKNIRAYNSAYQMTSFGANQVIEGSFMPTFKIQGQVYHLIGSLLSTDVPKFLQIYFIANYEDQVDVRQQNIPHLNSSLVYDLQNMLHRVNPYVNSFKAALESIPEDERNNYKFVINADKRQTGSHPGRYNAPTFNEVAVLLVDQECDRRDIVLRTHDNQLQRISETHRAYDSLQYPLMFCRGEDGYSFAVYNVDPCTGDLNFNKKTSAMQFYSFLIQLRDNEHVYLHRFRGLFNQFLVDQYAKIETERLVFIRTNQRKLRAENYIDLRDALQQDTDTENLGRMVILPSTFTGSPRYMAERTQDAFCYVRKYGGADLFITMTTNPKWLEIENYLLPGQASYDRHDLISRVFHLKQKRLIDLLTKEKVFGAVRCFIFSIEWQKRGLPHSHNLLWLEEKIRPNEIDRVISAEIPNPDTDPNLHRIVKNNMIHGPCDTFNTCSPCIKEGRCTKRFPKNFVNETVTGENGYPSYRRRAPENGGFTAKLNVRGRCVSVDNRWVVPYSPVLLRTFESHLNVEYCASVESIKYICKYINKGSDQATFGLQSIDRDEVTKYQSGRYISTSEAVWRILGFSIHERHPPVMHLDVHLENGQRVYFNPENIRECLENPRRTTLLAYYSLCQGDSFARTLLYNEVPSYYTFDKKRGLFNRRQRGQPVEGYPGVFREHVLGRVYTVHPNNSECYYLRLLLHTVRGPTSYTDLKTYNGVEHSTFHETCSARGLLDDDRNWIETLEEATVSQTPSRLRHLFAVMLVFCELSNRVQIWEKYQRHLSEDFLYAARHGGGSVAESNVVNRCLCSLQDIVISISGNTLSHYGLPEPQETTEDRRISREYAAEISYNNAAMTEIVNNNIKTLTDEQKSVYDKILRSVIQQEGETFFLDAPGGTGKTFLTTLLLAEVRRQGKIALAVASSGIAATLLPGGKTAHTMFKIPLDLDKNETPVCDISRNSDKAKLLAECSLIVWDESTMAHKKAVEAVNRTLQDIRRNDHIMGKVTVLFCGDFRQTLPVITRGTRADEVSACLKRSMLWPQVKKLSLTRNMRAHLGDNHEAQEFSDILLRIGEGSFPESNGLLTLPENLCKIVSSVEELIHFVYGDISQLPYKNNSWLCERAILTTKNDQAAAINLSILEKVEADEVIYRSINKVLDQHDATTYPEEFLNSLSAPGLPAHQIVLKVGIPIMLLRNLTPPKLCNGTRLKVTSLQKNVIEAEIITGCGVGEVVFIPRIPLIPNNFPFTFKRLQFPVSVCFAMTINKSQGQTLRAAGVDLRTPCFSHGQLYVACSRVTSSDHLYILAPTRNTPNIVYKEIL